MSSFEPVLPTWLAHSLQSSKAAGGFGFSEPLEIQRTVLPRVTATLRSTLPSDMCLSAPTGSGKTLCYLAPMIERARAAKELAGGFTRLRGVVIVPTNALAVQVSRIAERIARSSPTPFAVGVLCDSANDNATGSASSGGQEGGDDEETTAAIGSSGHAAATSTASMVSNRTLCRTVRFASGAVRRFVAADLVVATPRRLLNELLVSFSSTGDVLEHMRLDCGQVSMLVFDEADTVLTGSFTSLARRISAMIDRDAEKCGGVVHKMLCSATLTEHLAKVADIRLRNVQYFSLGAPVSDANQQQMVAPSHAASSLLAGVSTVTSRIALPEGLHERYVIVDDPTRHASLVRVVAAALKVGSRIRHAKTVEDLDAIIQATSNDDPSATASSQLDGGVGTTLVFCASPPSARVLSHMLSQLNIRCVPLTAATTPQERAQALTAAFSGVPCVVLATDSIMRGVDLPGVSVVVMYDAAVSLQQYVHRVGRTARGGAEGVSVALVSKNGPSGGQEDGEVARFKALDSFLLRPEGGKRLPQQLVAFRRLDDALVTKVSKALAAVPKALKDSALPSLDTAGASSGGTQSSRAAAVSQQLVSMATATERKRPTTAATKATLDKNNVGAAAGKQRQGGASTLGDKRPRDEEGTSTDGAEEESTA